MGIFGLGDDVVKDDKTTDQKQSTKQVDKAVAEKQKAKQEAETCEFC